MFQCKDKPLHVLTFMKPCRWRIRPPGFFEGGLELHVHMQRQTPSCVDIHDTMPVDGSTTGLFSGGLELHVEILRQTPSCFGIHETMSVESSTAGLSLGGFGVACSNAKTNPVIC